MDRHTLTNIAYVSTNVYRTILVYMFGSVSTCLYFMKDMFWGQNASFSKTPKVLSK